MATPGGPAAADAHAKALPTPSPRVAIAPVIGAVRHRAAGARKHSTSPDIPIGSAQSSAKNPDTERTREAAAKTVTKMSAAEAAAIRRQEFRDKLKKAIEDATPKPATESQADHLMAQGSKDASHTLRGELNSQKQEAAGPMEAAAAREVPPSSQPAPPKTELAPEPLGAPPAPVSTAAVVPAPLPPEQLDYSEDRAPTEQAMQEGGVTQAQLEKGNEPSFQQSLSARATAEKHEATAEGKYRQSEASVQAKVHAQAQAAMAQGLGGMHGARALHVAGVIGQQVGTAAKDAAERKRITDTVTGIKDRTRTDVEAILKKMEDDATAAFERGLARAEQAYHDTFEEEKGGVGTWLTTWGSSWERLIENSLAKARVEYMRQVDVAIEEVADLVDGSLAAATQRVKDGLNDVDTFVAGLDAKVIEFGEAAKKEVAGDFEAMEKDIDDHRDALINKLAAQYKSSHERMLAMEEKLREENKSLWQRVYDATVGLIKKILAFKDMLLNVLAKAANVIGDIISDPIGFLGNLVEAVMRGLKNFMSRIGMHLQKGLMEWLFGALGGAGLQMPEHFDLQGIVSIVLQVLGLTYANFRARAVAIVGEPVVAALEKTAEVFKIILTEGVSGLWRFIKEKLSDLKSMVLDAILDYIKEKVIVAGITWVIGLLNPASAFFKACKAIYDIVMFFIERGSQILALVNAIIDSMAAIAKGSLDTAATWVENALAKAIPVAIGFLASLLGLGDISGTIRGVIEKAQTPVNKAIDWVINQAVKLVKVAGKALGKLLGKEEPEHDKKGEPADQLRRHVAEALASQLTKDHTREEAIAIVHRIAVDFRPLGLKSLEVGPESEEGNSPILAEASPKLPLAELTSGVPKPKGRTVTSKVQLLMDTESETPATELKPVNPATNIQTGGVAWTPSNRAAKTLNVVTWNTSNVNAPGNDSHAEHQFVHYMEGREELWATVEKITIVNVTRSPCSECGPELAALLKSIKAKRGGKPVTADIYWTTLHSSPYTPTSWQTLHTMESAGWQLHAPGNALPPEKTVHTESVHVKLLF